MANQTITQSPTSSASPNANRRISSGRRWLVFVTAAAGLAVLWSSLRPNANGSHSTSVVLGLLLTTYCVFWTVVALCSSYTRREILFRFIAATFATGLCVVLMEFAAILGVDFSRVFGMDPMVAWYSQNRTDPELLFIHQPNRHYVGTTRWSNGAFYWGIDSSREYKFDIKLDKNGFRNPQDHETADVVVIGDSFVEGREVLLNETAVAQVGERLKKTVINLGHTGYGPQQELAVLRRFALPLSPKVCVWVFFEGNDLEDTEKYDEIRSGGPLAGASDSAWFKRLFVRNLCHAIANWIGHREPRPEALVRSGVFHRSPNKETMYFLDKLHTLGDAEERALARTEECLTEAYRLCQEKNCQLLIAFAPSSIRVMKDHCSFPSNSEIPNWPVNDLPERVKKIGERISPEIGFVDLTPQLAEHASRGELVYFPEDTHWTARGHEIVAETLAHKLSGFLAEPRPSN